MIERNIKRHQNFKDFNRLQEFSNQFTGYGKVQKDFKTFYVIERDFKDFISITGNFNDFKGFHVGEYLNIL